MNGETLKAFQNALELLITMLLTVQIKPLLALIQIDEYLRGLCRFLLSIRNLLGRRSVKASRFRELLLHDRQPPCPEA